VSSEAHPRTAGAAARRTAGAAARRTAGAAARRAAAVALLPLHAVNETLLGLRDALTPGQRQTAALLLALALAVALLGRPTRIVPVASEPAVPAGTAAGGGPSSAPALVGGAGATTLPPLAAVESPTPTGGSATTPVAPSPAGRPLAGGGTALAAPAGNEATPGPDHAGAPPQLPRVVALVRPAGSALPGTSDADVARAFLAAAPFRATVVADQGPDAAVCREVVEAGSVVLASLGLDAPLRSCLVAAGETLLDLDTYGDLPPRPGQPGQVVSVLRGIGPSLVDAGGFGARSGALRGRVGVLSTVGVQPAVTAVLPGLSAEGVHVVATAFLPGTEPGDPSALDEAVLRFRAAGVQAVLVDAPVWLAGEWATEAALVSPGTRYVVADGFDAVTDESYPPVFQGALAYTTVRGPWYARAHGTTAAQAACQAAFAKAAASPGAAKAADDTLVYGWCEEVSMAAAAWRAAPSGVPFATALRSERVASPLTSDLGPLRHGGFGPTEDAVVVWEAACGCFVQRSGFAPRPARGD
jgi:hypothetical protein